MENGRNERQYKTGRKGGEGRGVGGWGIEVGLKQHET